MSTVAEIIDAVKHLSPAQKKEFVLQLESVLTAPAPGGSALEDSDYPSAEFTRHLIEHFHRAKRAALSQT